MNIFEAEKNYLTKDKSKHTTQIGRYSASSLGSIMNGYLTPANFFKEKPIDKIGAGKMLTGIFLEDGLTKLLENANADCIYQPKYELKIDDFVLVVKLDFQLRDRIWETKWTEKTISEAMNTYQFQLQSQWEATDHKLPVYLTRITVPFGLEEYPFTPSEERWELIKEKLRIFHKTLLGITQSVKGIDNKP